MIPKGMEDALNAQIKNELESAYIYLSMAAYCDAQDYLGFASWLQVQSREELAHAMRFFEFINDRGGKVTLQAISQPPTDFNSLVDVFEQLMSHEVKISAQIHDLYELAIKEDSASIPFLQTFIVEQVEEEKNAAITLAWVKRANDDRAAIMALDRRMGERTQ